MTMLCRQPGRQEVLFTILVCAVIVLPVSAGIFFSPSAPGIITKGDSFTVSGTGEVNGTVAVWIIGRDHFETLTTVPDSRGNFSISIKPSATDSLSSGQYIVLFQDPGADHTMEIDGGTDVNGSLVVMNKGKIISHLGPQEDLGENIHAVGDQILETTALPGVDDTFRAEYFFVQKPAIFFDRLIPASGFHLPDQISGGPVIITGTTNLATDNTIDMEIRNRDTSDVITRQTIPVIGGSPMNTWAWDIDTPGLPPGNYNLTVWSEKANVTIEGSFTVKIPSPPVPSPGIPAPGGNTPPPPTDDYTFPVLVACSLIVLAIVLYYARE